jgi:ADP-heptose:LPS heptosyltransferase
VTWLTEPKNVVLLAGLRQNLKCLAWEERHVLPDVRYDLVINLEDTVEVGQYLKSLQTQRIFGAYLGDDGCLRYTDDSRQWFDLSLISIFGRQEADRLKLLNRKTYQDLIFSGLGLRFTNQDTYLLPKPADTDLSGDVAISPEAGPVWPMKNWAYYGDLKRELEARGLTVNLLPRRASLLEHLGDVRNHRCFVGGDSLPMHLALGLGIRCVSLFTCTSPWEIHDYGIQRKIVSPLLAEFFYKRGYDKRATTAISLEEVLNAVLAQLNESQAPTPAPSTETRSRRPEALRESRRRRREEAV